MQKNFLVEINKHNENIIIVGKHKISTVHFYDSFVWLHFVYGGLKSNMAAT